MHYHLYHGDEMGMADFFFFTIVSVSSSFLRGLTPSCSLGSLLSYQSPIVFLDHWYPCFWNFDSIIPVDVIRVKPSVDNFL